MRVDTKTGNVTSVEVMKSTGHKILDDSAIEALQRWRFKPGIMSSTVKMPITFTHHVFEELWASARAQALSTPRPDYPDAVRDRGITGQGVFIANLDSKTGTVRSVATLRSTGNELLDQAALKALRQWKFKPGRLLIVRVPIKLSREGVQL